MEGSILSAINLRVCGGSKHTIGYFNTGFAAQNDKNFHFSFTGTA
jgi:hypothetical protein